MKLFGSTNGKQVVASMSRHDYVSVGEGEDRICQDGGQAHTNHYAGYTKGWGKRIVFEVPQTFAELFSDYQYNQGEKPRKYGIWDIEDVRILPKEEWPNVDSIEEKVENFVWGSNGPDGKEKLKYVLLKDCSLDHLKNIIKNVHSIHEGTKEVIEYLIKNKGSDFKQEYCCEFTKQGETGN